MEIKQFIEKAIEGGWKDLIIKGKEHHIFFSGGGAYAEPNFIQVGYTCVGIKPPCNKDSIGFTKYEILLDPKAWQAVGKVEGWGTIDNCPCCKKIHHRDEPKWLYNMHRMVDFICEGGTIEEYVKTL